MLGLKWNHSSKKAPEVYSQRINLQMVIIHQNHKVFKSKVLNNSWPQRKCGYDFKCVDFKHNLGIDIFSIHVNITLELMPVDLIDSKLTLFQVMAWCHLATSHYVDQYWPRSPAPYVVTRPQWLRTHFSYTLSSEYRVARNRYPCLLFTSGDHRCTKLCVQEQSTNTMSQCQCPSFMWRHRSTVVTSQ